MSKSGKFLSLRLLFAVAFVAVLAYQALWQIYGHKNPKFVKFIRQYNRRPDFAGKVVRRGTIVDRKGVILAQTGEKDIWSRRYPLGEAAVHPVGYYHPKYGITAIERICDAQLSGSGGELKVSSFKELRKFVADTTRPKCGKTVKLSIDSKIQAAAYKALGGRRGAAIVLQPSTGKLLALVSSPSFDPTAPQDFFSNSEKPVFNRAVQGLYPPGSTFKIAVAAIAADAKLAPPLFCSGGGYIASAGTPPIRDSEYYEYARRGEKWGGWGVLSLHEALVHSSNVYFSQLAAKKIGTELFSQIGIKAQLNQALPYFKEGSAVLETKAGNFPKVRKNASLAALGIGQGELLLTPMHVAAFTAGIANGGIIMTPQLSYDATPERLSRLCSKRTADLIANALADVVENGTGRGMKRYFGEVSGKTGTAQVDKSGAQADHSWFTCFAPRKKPAVCVTVLIENGGYGSAAALPCAGEILKVCRKLGYL